jgi:hypothetical protein
LHHSYEGLDRAGGFSRVRLLSPLRHRDFRMLWGGMCVSLLGLSFALTGPVSAAIGVRATLIGAGVLGSIVTLAALFAPGMRDIEGQSSEPSSQPSVATPSPATIDSATYLRSTIQVENVV